MHCTSFGPLVYFGKYLSRSPEYSESDQQVNAMRTKARSIDRDDKQLPLGPRIAALLESRPEVLEAYLFGSHAQDRAQPHSDIDVAVYVDDAHEDRSAFGLRADLTTLLMQGLRDNGIDLLILNQAPPVLYYHVLRDGERVLSRNLAATTTREGRAVSRYCDFVPQLAKMEAARSFSRGIGS